MGSADTVTVTVSLHVTMSHVAVTLDVQPLDDEDVAR
jgi:hypothetical protein